MNPPHTGYDLVPDKYKEIYKHLNVESYARIARTFRPRELKWETTSATISVTTMLA